jgi:glycolate oxidase
MLVGYRSVEDAAGTVSDIIAEGILPAAVEMMDALAIEAAEAAVSCGYPAGAVAVLVIELDGPQVEVEAQFAQVEQIALRRDAFETRIAADAAERALMWKGRKSAFAAVGRISPSYFVQDGVIPRTKLPEVLADITPDGRRGGLRVANVFHAGDGNLHPLVLFDDAVEDRRTTPRSWPAPSWTSASPPAARSPASTASARRSAQDGQAVHRRGPGHHAAGPLRVRPRRHRQPGQGLPDAPAVRRAPGPRKGENPFQAAGLGEVF